MNWSVRVVGSVGGHRITTEAIWRFRFRSVVFSGLEWTSMKARMRHNSISTFLYFGACWPQCTVDGVVKMMCTKHKTKQKCVQRDVPCDQWHQKITLLYHILYLLQRLSNYPSTSPWLSAEWQEDHSQYGRYSFLRKEKNVHSTSYIRIHIPLLLSMYSCKDSNIRSTSLQHDRSDVY